MIDSVETSRRRMLGYAVRWAGLLAGAALAWPAGTLGPRLGTGFLTGITAFCVCAMAGVLAADGLRAGPQGAVRRATLTPRRVRDQLPRRTTGLLTVQAALLVALLAGAWAAGSPDDAGRAGRALTVACAEYTLTRGPWPGAYYGLPLLGLLAAGTVLCAWTLRRIVLTAATDTEGLRHRARTVIAAWGLSVTAPLAGTALLMSSATRAADCLGAPAHALAWTLLPVALLAVVSAAWCVANLVPRGPRR
ncbi:hypothetical protein OG393_32030 [Streptomyces sp. NBC_01216]|uniref:hypothetical protein n=1 Tax=Streptomyces sp. NBC_01216 TaxID=2903778 RepID=UPI002E11C986|nr:hypothetical protein OG393_32030 [Streptomyces sp. NBC_01216]